MATNSLLEFQNDYGPQTYSANNTGTADVSPSAVTSEDNRTANSANSNQSTSNPPPKANDAPKGNTMYNYVGLCDAMNSYEKSLVKAGVVEIANQYEIKFSPTSLASSKTKPPGPTVIADTSNQNSDTAKNKIDPATNTSNMTGKRFSVLAGQQIIQFIELVMRNSTYITSQLKATQDATDVSKKATPNSSSKATTWFRISVNAVPIGNKKDKKRNDYAYKITYIVTTYAINQMQSQYFPDAKFRGIHKVYNYWFTGLNTQVINYEQSYNTQFFNVMSSRDVNQGIQGALNDPLALSIGGPRNIPAQPGQTVQGSPNDANTPAATGADYLYSFSDQGSVTLRIVGDPAWLLQGEIKGVTAENISFSGNGFYPDGTVCFETQEVVFAINFRAPTDYNNGAGSGGPVSGTGLMDTMSSASQINGGPVSTQASAAYRAMTVKSTFSKGKFEQEITGTALTNLNPSQIAAATGNGRPASVGGLGGIDSGLIRSAGSGALSNNATMQDAPLNADAVTSESTANSVSDFESGLPPDNDNSIPTISIQASPQPLDIPRGATSNGEHVDEIIYSGDPRVGNPVSAAQMNTFLGVNTGAASSTGANFGVRTPTSAASSEFYTADDIRARRLARWAAEDAAPGNQQIGAPKDP